MTGSFIWQTLRNTLRSSLLTIELVKLSLRHPGQLEIRVIKHGLYGFAPRTLLIRRRQPETFATQIRQNPHRLPKSVNSSNPFLGQRAAEGAYPAFMSASCMYSRGLLMHSRKP